MRRRLLAVVLLVVLAGGLSLFLMGDSGPVLDAGPLGSGGDHALVCVPSDNGTVTFAYSDLENTGSAPAVIERVALHNPKDVTLLAVYVGELARNYSGWPTFPPQLAYVHRSAVPGASIAPGGGIPHGRVWHPVDLIVGLRLTGKVGSTEIDVWYREAGHDYHLRENATLETALGQRGCLELG